MLWYVQRTLETEIYIWSNQIRLDFFLLFNPNTMRCTTQCSELLEDQSPQQHHGNDVGSDEHVEDILPSSGGDKAGKQWPNCRSDWPSTIDNGRHRGQSIGISLQGAVLAQLCTYRGCNQGIWSVHKDADHNQEHYADCHRQCTILLIHQQLKRIHVPSNGFCGLSRVLTMGEATNNMPVQTVADIPLTSDR